MGPRPSQDLIVAEPGARLDQFLARRLSGHSRGYFQDLIARGCVLVGGAPRPPDHRLRPGDVVTVRWPQDLWAPLSFEDWVLHEDSALIVLNKPAGLLMHPVGGTWLSRPEAVLTETEPSVAGLLYKHRRASSSSGVHRCGIIHRLDRETSGIFVAAKTPAAQEALLAAFAERRVEKRYRAVVLGRLEGRLEVDAPLGRLTGRRRIRVSAFGREAATSFKTLGTGRGASLVEARPLTGRTHQIRAHLGHVGHPVLGDPEWPGANGERLAVRGLPQPPRMMLHAYSLTVPHPRTDKPARFTAPPPKDFKDYWKQVEDKRR